MHAPQLQAISHLNALLHEKENKGEKRCKEEQRRREEGRNQEIDIRREEADTNSGEEGVEMELGGKKGVISGAVPPLQLRRGGDK